MIDKLTARGGRLGLAFFVQCIVLGFSLPAFAADEGEYCGHIGTAWQEICADGLTCDIRFSFGAFELGRCVGATDGDLVCGGLQGTACPDAQFCKFTPAQRCGAADQTGVCSAVPEACTEEYAPVCGCDGKTYGNACAAQAASQSVAAVGECGECTYEGEVHPLGEQFPAADGCNSCSCVSSGEVSCTQKACGSSTEDQDGGVPDEAELDGGL